MTLFPSRFPGKCQVCEKPYAQGDKVFWRRGMKSAEHALCSEEGKKTHELIVASKTNEASPDFNVSCPEGLSYLPYQKAGIEFASKRRGTLIADEMGLGKTIQGVGLINSDESITSVLIVCPKTLKLNWKTNLRNG